MTSLIQQRIAIDRQRIFATVGIVFGALGLLLGLTIALADIASWTSWGSIGVWIAVLALNITNLAQARRRVIAFEAEHGPGAGSQESSSPRG